MEREELKKKLDKRAKELEEEIVKLKINGAEGLNKKAIIFIEKNPSYKGIISRHHVSIIMADFAKQEIKEFIEESMPKEIQKFCKSIDIELTEYYIKDKLK